MSTDYYTVCEKCRKAGHLLNSHARDNPHSQMHAVTFMAEHMHHGHLRVYNDALPDDVEVEKEPAMGCECWCADCRR